AGRSTCTGPARTPSRADVLATCAARALAIMVLVGVQPVLTQGPPNSPRSARRTCLPVRASRAASGIPAWPLPTMMTSTFMPLLLAQAGPSSGAGAEARQPVAPIRRIEVPPGIAEQAPAGGPAAPAQDLVRRREPRLRVLLVGIGDESGIGLEVARGPLPHVSDHLAAAVGAVALGMAPDLDRSARAAIQVGAGIVGRIVSPGEPALARRGGGELPLRFVGKPASRPAAIRFRLEPADVDDRLVGGERRPFRETPDQPPPPAVAAPVDRVLRGGQRAPAPARGAPVPLLPVPASLDEGGELLV